jgi:hypothetical protein
MHILKIESFFFAQNDIVDSMNYSQVILEPTRVSMLQLLKVVPIT